MPKTDVFRAQTFAEFSITLKGTFTPVANRRLDAIVRNRTLPAEDRFDALLLRTSWGNHSEFACSFVNKSQEPAEPETPVESRFRQPMAQKRFATILGLSKQRISAIVKLREEQGLLLVESGLLIPVSNPVTARAPQEDSIATPGPWKAFSLAWASQHPDLMEEYTKAHEVIERINRQKLADYKAAQKVQGSPDATAVSDSADSAPPSTALPREGVPHSPDQRSTTPETVSAPRGHGHGIDTRVHAKTLNLKEEVSIENPPAGGRSPVSTEPPARPTGGSDYKEPVRQWLEKHVKLPVPLQDPELGQIADTILTDAHFEQFQRAAVVRAARARGWRYFVTIAQQCQQHQEKYSAAAAGGEPPAKKEESTAEFMQRMRKELKENG